MPMISSSTNPQVAAPTPSAPAPAKITGDARLNAILRILQEKHGFHFPVALFDPKTDK